MKENFIRNFVIISHIDHGKSTLADRFLELTKTVPFEKMRPQYLDSMNLEREKGITIKIHPVRMIFKLKGQKYLLNLIDTPGHIDFAYEISRALACVEGAILLVDASKGIQAQTLFNLEMAQREGLKVIGVVNKIDLPTAQIFQTKKELSAILKVKPEEIFLISALEGKNVSQLLSAIVERIPPPQISDSEDFKALIFDSQYDPFSGVIAFVRVFQGQIKKGDSFYLMAQKIKGEVKEVGVFLPQLTPSFFLKAGEIGYLKTGIKEPSKVRVGDTIIIQTSPSDSQRFFKIKPFPGYQEPQPVLFLTIYPELPQDFENLKRALEKLKLQDPSLNFHPESKIALGRGFRCGFLGPLQAEIILRQLKEDFNLEIISTPPQVVFKVLTKKGEILEISSPHLWPDSSLIKETLEPFGEIEIIVSFQYLNQLYKILKKYQILLKTTQNFLQTPNKSWDLQKVDNSKLHNKLILKGEVPLRKIISGNFYDELKGATQGYASFSFRLKEFKKGDLVKLDILIAKKKEEAFSKIVSQKEAFLEGKTFLKKLKEILPPQQFPLILQAAIGGRIIARETIPARRKNVTAPLYGGDFTRKRKLLEIQKRGKKRLLQKAKVKIPPEVFLKILK